MRVRSEGRAKVISQAEKSYETMGQKGQRRQDMQQCGIAGR
jgi:hypothetical protein